MKMFNRKKIFYSTGSVIISVIFIAIILLFNFVTSTLTDRFSLKYDFTESKLYELSDDTVEFMKTVDKPIDLYYFVSDITMTSNITETLEKIAALNKNVDFTMVSADKNPTLAQRFTTADTKLGMYTIVVDDGKNFKTIAYEDFFGYNPISQQNDILIVESKIISAINTIARDKKITVGFTTGHGEDTATAMKGFLSDDNISHTDISLVSDDFKAQCDIVCIAAPVTDFTAEEIDRLDAYIKNGGKVQLYFTMNSEPMPKLYSYLNECGIEVGNNMVFEGDSSKVIGNTAYCFAATLAEHNITNNLIENGALNVVQMSRTITPASEYKNGFSLKTLQKTGNKAVSRSIMTAEEEAAGELSLSVIASYNSEDAQGGTLLVSGSYVSFAGAYAEYNKDLYLSSIIRMTDSEESYSISPKFLYLTRLNISQLSIILWMIVVIYVFPAAIFIAGLFVWYRRRHL